MRAISSALPQLLRLSSEMPSGCQPALVHQPAHAGTLQAERDLGLHVGELFLDELVGGERPAELLALEGVLSRRVPAELGAPIAPQAIP
jgi:hypothetical protein